MPEADAMGSDDRPDRGAAVIASDRACVQCGYNVRGLTRESRCPECGSPVADSFADYFLSADPKWRKVLLAAAVLLIAASVLRFGGWCLSRRFPGLVALPAIHPGLSCMWLVSATRPLRRFFEGREFISPAL